MKFYNKTLQGLSMKAYNDSGVEWVIQSIDSDGFERTERYNKKAFTLAHAFELHSNLYANI